MAALAFSPTAPQLAYLSENGAVTVADLTDPATRHMRRPESTMASAGAHQCGACAVREDSLRA